MIQISNLKLQIPHTTKRLKEKALKQLHIREQDLIGFRLQNVLWMHGKSRCCIMSIHWNYQ